MGVYLGCESGFLPEIKNLSDELFSQLKGSIDRYLDFYYIKKEEATREEVIEKLYGYVDKAKTATPYLKARKKNKDVLRIAFDTLDPLFVSRVKEDSRAGKYYQRMLKVSEHIRSYPDHIELADHLNYYRICITLMSELLKSKEPISDFCFDIDKMKYSEFIEEFSKGKLFPTVKAIGKKNKVKPEYDLKEPFSNISVTFLLICIAYAIMMNNLPVREELQ